MLANSPTETIITPAKLIIDPLFASLPLVAILRGINPAEIPDVADVLVDEGFNFLEVPLNSPGALQSIEFLAKRYGRTIYSGAGTVTDLTLLELAIDAGARLIVTPNMNPAVIRRAAQAGCVILPGVLSPTEAFEALAYGASGLKLFPAETLGPAHLKALRAVLPTDVACLPVGGVEASSEQMNQFRQVGANGFGLGSGLYQPSMTLSALKQRARQYRQAWELSQ